MKDLSISIWSRLSGRTYSTVNQSTHNDELHQQWDANFREYPDPGLYARSLRRKSSVVINQFFKNALPVDSTGSPKWTKSIYIWMITGLINLIIGYMILVIQPYDFIFKWKATFTNGGEIYEIWRAPPVDLYLKVYLFNVTNHEEYMNHEISKLKFEEVGPYVYKEILEHGNVTFNNNGTVTAEPRHPLQFMPELSNGVEDDVVVMPNIALLGIMEREKLDQDFTTLYTSKLAERFNQTIQSRTRALLIDSS